MAVTKDQLKESRKEKADLDTIMSVLKASKLYTDNQLTDIKTRLNTDGPDGAWGELKAAYDQMAQSPEGRARLRDTLAQRKEERLSRRFAPFFQTATAIGDIGTSLGQIRQANRESADLMRPAAPPVPNIDPLLNQQILDAQRGTYDTARALGPARQELQDQYAKDIALAKSIGSGQASTLGALGQVASMRRARGAASLLPIMDQIRAREEGRLDNLAIQRGDAIDRNYRNRAYQYMNALDQYNKDAAAIGGLGAAGRTNLRASMQNLLGGVPGVAARFGNQGYVDRFSGYENSLDSALTNGPATYSPYGNRPYYRRGPAIADSWVVDPVSQAGTASARMRYRPIIGG